jgi:hypothetical protein
VLPRPRPQRRDTQPRALHELRRLHRLGRRAHAHEHHVARVGPRKLAASPAVGAHRRQQPRERSRTPSFPRAPRIERRHTLLTRRHPDGLHRAPLRVNRCQRQRPHKVVLVRDGVTQRAHGRRKATAAHREGRRGHQRGALRADEAREPKLVHLPGLPVAAYGEGASRDGHSQPRQGGHERDVGRARRAEHMRRPHGQRLGDVHHAPGSRIEVARRCALFDRGAGHAVHLRPRNDVEGEVPRAVPPRVTLRRRVHQGEPRSGRQRLPRHEVDEARPRCLRRRAGREGQRTSQPVALEEHHLARHLRRIGNALVCESDGRLGGDTTPHLAQVEPRCRVEGHGSRGVVGQRLARERAQRGRECELRGHGAAQRVGVGGERERGAPAPAQRPRHRRRHLHEPGVCRSAHQQRAHHGAVEAQHEGVSAIDAHLLARRLEQRERLRTVRSEQRRQRRSGRQRV